MEISEKRSLFLENLLTSSSNQKLLVFSLIGLILMGLGVLSFKNGLFASSDKVEILNSGTEGQSMGVNNQEIVVEIAGAVKKPGVYKFNSNARIDDLLISAGGISVDADRGWVDKYINRASKLVDGQKIYIYHTSEVIAKENGGIKLDQQILGTTNSISSGLININTASQSELEKLVGIGPVYAQKMIEHRPYSSVEELVSKGVVSQKTFDKFKNDISIY